MAAKILLETKFALFTNIAPIFLCWYPEEVPFYLIHHMLLISNFLQSNLLNKMSWSTFVSCIG